jgi:hypothetical protein
MTPTQAIIQTVRATVDEAIALERRIADAGDLRDGKETQQLLAFVGQAYKMMSGAHGFAVLAGCAATQAAEATEADQPCRCHVDPTKNRS